MRRFSLLAAFVLLLAAPVMAEDSPMEFGGWGGVSLGAQYLSVDDINSEVDAYGVEFQNIGPRIGVHGHGLLFERLVIGGRGSVTAQLDETGLYDVTYTVTNGSVEIGYAVMNSAYGIAFPSVGLGGASQVVRFETNVEIGGEPWQADDVEIAKSSVYATVGMTYYFPVRFAGGESRGFAMFLPGIHVGGTLQVADTGWRNDHAEAVRFSADAPYNTVFVQLDLAFGGGVKSESPMPLTVK